MEAGLGACVAGFYEEELEGAVDGISPELGTGGCCIERVWGVRREMGEFKVLPEVSWRWL